MNKYKVECECGKKTIFPPLIKKDYKICSWCGRKVYRDKKVEFKDKLNKLMNK